MTTATCVPREEFARTGIFWYEIAGQGRSEVDKSALVAAIEPADVDAFYFSYKTATRNATAGLLADKPDEAFKRVKARHASWSDGKWQAASERSGEPRESLLARAVAEALYGGDVAQAVEDLTAAIQAAYEAAGVDPDSEDATEKAKVRKIAKDLRDQLRDSDEVRDIYARMQKEEIDRKLGEKAKVDGEAKPKSASSLLKR